MGSMHKWCHTLSQTNISKSMSAPNATAIGLKRHNLHEAISQSTHFLHPVSEEDDVVQWGTLLAKWTRTGSHESRAWLPIMTESCVAVWEVCRSPIWQSTASNALIEYLWLPVLLWNGTSESTLKQFINVIHLSPYCASTSITIPMPRRTCSCIWLEYRWPVCCPGADFCRRFEHDDGEDETQCFAPFPLFA